MNFKETALLLGLSMTVPATSIAQDKVEASVGADLVSGYIWRGQDLGGVSIQPSLSVAYKGFSLGACKVGTKTKIPKKGGYAACG